MRPCFFDVDSDDKNVAVSLTPRAMDGVATNVSAAPTAAAVCGGVGVVWAADGRGATGDGGGVFRRGRAPGGPALASGAWRMRRTSC